MHEFHELEATPRRKMLSERYNFDCDCIACRENWPELVGLICSEKVSCIYVIILFIVPNSFVNQFMKEYEFP